METGPPAPLAAAFHMQLFTGPISSQAGEPDTCSAAPALSLAGLTSADAVTLVP